MAEQGFRQVVTMWRLLSLAEPWIENGTLLAMVFFNDNVKIVNELEFNVVWIKHVQFDNEPRDTRIYESC